jgi:hypothetical protein
MTRSDRPPAVKYADMEHPRLTSDDYDSPRKDVLTRYFPKFMAFFFPHAHAEIDWREPHVFFDQELAQVIQGAELGMRLVDHLVQVPTRASGLQCNGFISMSKSRFSTMPVPRTSVSPTTTGFTTATAARSPAWPYWPMTPNTGSRPDTVINCSDARSASASRSSRILDYANQTEALLEDANTFAPVTATHLFTRRTKDDPEQRYVAKWRLARLLYERHWDRQRIIDLFSVIDWLMRLPAELEQRLL